MWTLGTNVPNYPTLSHITPVPHYPTLPYSSIMRLLSSAPLQRMVLEIFNILVRIESRIMNIMKMYLITMYNTMQVFKNKNQIKSKLQTRNQSWCKLGR